MKSGYLALHCQSLLAPYAEEYVAQKRAFGIKCRGEVEILNMFDSFCIERGLSKAALPQDLYDAWCEKRPHENGSTHRIRVDHIRRFAKFLANHCVEAPAVYLPLPRSDKSFLPHIFTHDEIRRLLEAVDTIQPCTRYGRQSLIHIIAPVLFRMLYCCGLRIGEALRLKSAAVDLKTGIIRLIETKGDRERLVPMSASLTRLCDEYRSNPLVMECRSEYFFPTPDGDHYAVCTIYERFRVALFAAGISHGGRGKGPRLHDLRHTFAVHSMNKWAAEGKDLYVLLPVLMVYLGHKNMKSTEKYLRLVPEAYAQVTAPFEERFGED